MALIRDGAFVGEGRVGFVAPGDGVDLGFGGDDKVKVDRAPTNRKENEPTWFNQTKIETREFVTSVKNLHAFPVKVQVIHRLPVSENAAIVVDLAPSPRRRPTTGRRQARGDGLDARAQARRIEGRPLRLPAEMAGRPGHHRSAAHREARVAR